MEERTSDGTTRRVLVTGAGGFIGHHLVTLLRERGYWVRGVDLKLPEFTEINADEFELLDLRRRDDALVAVRGVDEVYALAADMGGMGFISSNHATILHNNALINLHTIEAARPQGVRGRNSDNDKLRRILGWEPGISLEDGLVPTYRWIEEQVGRSGAGPPS